jgi:hypothetical protein
MRRRWRTLVQWLAVIAGGGVLFLPGGHLSGQTTAPAQVPSPLAPGQLTVRKTDNETMPRLFPGPKGEVFRLWQREGDPRTGGGAVLLAATKGQDAWQELVEFRSSAPGVTARDGDLAVGPSGELAVVYRWWRYVPRSKQLRVARSVDGGKTWSEPPTAVEGSGKAFSPRIAWSGKSVVVVWADERRADQIFDVYARRSPDGGQTWESEQRLSRFPEQAPGDLYARPLLVSDGKDRLWAVWLGIRSWRSAFYLSRSTDGGRHWAEPVELTGDDSRSVFGHVLVRAEDRLLFVWHDTRTGHDRVYAVSSSDAGATWTAPVRVDHLPADPPVNASFPTVVLAPDGQALVAWQDTRNGRHDIFLARSTDGGRTWDPDNLRMDTDDPGTAISRLPDLARAGDGQVALAWEDDRAGFEQIYLRVRSAGDKREWGPEIRVTTPTAKTASHMPQLLWGTDGVLHLAWEVWDMSMAPTHITKQVDGRALKPGSR